MFGVLLCTFGMLRRIWLVLSLGCLWVYEALVVLKSIVKVVIRSYYISLLSLVYILFFRDIYMEGTEPEKTSQHSPG